MVVTTREGSSYLFRPPVLKPRTYRKYNRTSVLSSLFPLVQLVCVLIDEVESLTAARKSTFEGDFLFLICLLGEVVRVYGSWFSSVPSSAITVAVIVGFARTGGSNKILLADWNSSIRHLSLPSPHFPHILPPSFPFLGGRKRAVGRAAGGQRAADPDRPGQNPQINVHQLSWAAPRPILPFHRVPGSSRLSYGCPTVVLRLLL